jgi:hypothetical protein
MTQQNPNNPKFNDNVKRFTEEVEVAGNQVVDRVREVIEQGNARRLILRNEEGRTLLEIPLTAGAVVGGALLWFNPLLAGVAAIGGMLMKVRIEIERDAVDALEDAAENVGEAVETASRKAKRKADEVASDVAEGIENITDGQPRG